MARKPRKGRSVDRLSLSSDMDGVVSDAGQQIVADAGIDALTFLRCVLNDPANDTQTRMRAAVTLAQYTHTRTKDGGKKIAREEAANKVAESSKFAPAAAPKLVAVK